MSLLCINLDLEFFLELMHNMPQTERAKNVLAESSRRVSLADQEAMRHIRIPAHDGVIDVISQTPPPPSPGP